MARRFADLETKLEVFKENFAKQEAANSSFKKDERMFVPKIDETTKSATVILRFIPDPDGIPFVKYIEHSFDYFKGTEKKKYWKHCVNTFGFERGCPLCKKVSEYYKSAFPEDKKLGGERGRKVRYVSNVYVEKNTNDPTTVGKVFIYKFGKKIYEKLNKHTNPKDIDFEDPDFKTFNPHNIYGGARFVLNVKPQGDYPNYDDSKFSAPSVFLFKQGDTEEQTDDKIGEVLEKTYKLSEFIDPKLFPTNEELIAEIGFLIGFGSAPEPKKEQSNMMGESQSDVPFFDEPTPSSHDEDDDFFNNI